MTSYVSYTAYMFQNILIGLVCALLLGWLGIKIANRMGLIDIPGRAPHKAHARPTPIAGGIALFLTAIPLIIIFGSQTIGETMAIVIPAVILFVLGLWDDFRQVTPKVKFSGQILAAIVMIWLGVSVQIFQPSGILLGKAYLCHILNWGLTIFWVVGITNAVNFVDSMDGLALGLGAIAFAFFMLVSLDAGQMQLSRISASLFGICVGLYIFNSPPARLFLGDSGAEILGFLLAVVAILYTPRGLAQISSWYVPILLLGVPIFDTCLVVFSRLRRHKHIYQSALDHTYHRLIALGLDQNRSVLIMQIASLILSCLAFICLSLSALLGNIVFGIILFVGLILFFLLDRKSRWT
jgi:UDP-GlcNAc:undecaprenyl-phosphate GlcNAc-1-phosphate transferase